MNIQDAAKELLAGKKIRRGDHSMFPTDYFCSSPIGFIHFYTGLAEGEHFKESDALRVEDLLADDWEVYNG